MILGARFEQVLCCFRHAGRENVAKHDGLATLGYWWLKRLQRCTHPVDQGRNRRNAGKNKSHICLGLKIMWINGA